MRKRSDNRRVDRLTPEAQAAVRAARRAVQSKSGKALLRRRGEVVERSFEHVLDCGGARRTTLRGRANVRKRYLVQAMCANLSLLLRALGGPGTLKQTWAASAEACSAFFASLRTLPRPMWARVALLAHLTAVLLLLTQQANPLAHARR